MLFTPPLVPATLIARYKRFLFDAVLEDGTAITGSCPNTGSMRGLTTPGSRIWMSEHDSPTRKYRHMLEMVEADGTVVGINTGMPNRLAEEAILNGRIRSLPAIRRSGASRNTAAIPASISCFPKLGGRMPMWK